MKVLNLNFINAYILGKLLYGLPLCLGMSVKLHEMLHKVCMRSARLAIGNYCFKKSTSYILSNCKMLPIKKLVYFASINFLFKILKNDTPKSIMDYFKKQSEQNSGLYLIPKYCPKTAISRNSLI